MQYGAHLPVVDFDGSGWPPGRLAAYARTASALGYEWLGVNDHLAFARPWLDGIVALASVVDASGDLNLATTIALPVVRGAAVVAKAAGALDVLSGGRFVLGVGPGSSALDYDLVGLRFDERWARFDGALRTLRTHLSSVDTPDSPALLPRAGRSGGVPIWVASWGSEAGLRRVARSGDGWLASAYNASPDEIAIARTTLGTALEGRGRRIDGFPCVLATMWLQVTDDDAVRRARLEELAAMLNRPAEQLSDRVLVGSVERCAAVVKAYAAAGIDRIFVWPLAAPEKQLERFMLEVVPAAMTGSATDGSRR
jgi:alkanesulfonate monooxygenase SsuD/methylene tetrahydromethanopterin reductase-like flavin-dependent oxidoreductase (luciferase family)